MRPLKKYSCNVEGSEDCVVFIGKVSDSPDHKETDVPLCRSECKYVKRYADATRNAWRACWVGHPANDKKQRTEPPSSAYETITARSRIKSGMYGNEECPRIRLLIISGGISYFILKRINNPTHMKQIRFETGAERF